MIGAACRVCDGILIGALMTGAMVRAAIIVLAIYLPALAVLVPLFANHGLWAALKVMNAARGITLFRPCPGILSGLSCGSHSVNHTLSTWLMEFGISL